MTTPAEYCGRTLYFDWVDYVGGLFEGLKVRCQIVSVPGQEHLAGRRSRIIESADAVVLVADSRPEGVGSFVRTYRELAAWCRTQAPPVGIVVQANKQDAEDSLPRNTLWERVGASTPVPVVETVATDGDGVREAFVLGVRLGLDRVRAIALSGKLRHGRPEVNSPDQLMTFFADEPPVGREIPAPTLQNVASDGTPNDYEEPFAPHADLPGGFVWPPVDGRALLQMAAELDLNPTRTKTGEWTAASGGFRFQSHPDLLYRDTSAGRFALIEWARLHAMHLKWLSTGRTLMLAPAGNGRHRLWQLIRVHTTLRERLLQLNERATPQAVAKEAFSVAYQLVAAREHLRTSGLELACTLWTVGVQGSEPVFVALMPGPNEKLTSELRGAALIEREFAPVFRRWRSERADYPEITQSLSELAEAQSKSAVLKSLLAIV